jgi:hypothetical protein
MEKNVYNIKNLIDIIKEYSLNLHKTTFRYGIDYIKCDPFLKEKYPEILKELEEYFIPRKVIFIYKPISESSYLVRTIIEIGNKYELESMIGVPKARLTPINENETKIEDLEWILLENLSENEINKYKNNLKLRLTIVNYDWLNQNKIYELIKLVGERINEDKFIENLTSNKYDNIILDVNKLNLENRFTLADTFNPKIREDCLNTIKTIHPEVELIERHNWLDTLGVIPKDLLRVMYYGSKYEIYI